MLQFAVLHVLDFHELCPELYDLDTTLSSARVMLEREPSNEVARSYLGAVLYRSGHHEEAAEHLEKATVAWAGMPRDEFLLAMNSWKLGRKTEARAHYDRAVDWMERTKTRNPRWIRLRNEAAQLLGLHPTDR